MSRGDKNYLESVKQKKKQTLQRNFGEVGLKHESIKEKRIQTSLQKYETSHPKKSKQVKEKCRQNLIKKYGVDNWMKTNEAKKVFREIWKKKMRNYVLKLVNSRNLDLVSEYETAHEKVILKCRTCQNNFEILWNSFQQGGGVCPTCFPKNHGFSFMEYEVKQFIKSLGICIKENNTELITPYELDIIIENKRIAIEFCGLWCHSSGGNVPWIVKKDYHKTKLNMCNKIGYRLITIFEDEWILKKNIVLNRLQHILNMTIAKKIRAENCQVCIIDFKKSKEFLDNYHLQNSSISSIRLGAFYEGNLISVMTFSKKSLAKGVKEGDPLSLELNRFCSHPEFHIHGIAQKFLKFFDENFLWREIISFADRRWSEGNVYKKLNFKLIEDDPEPNYWYWGKGIQGRKHRFNYSKSKLKSMKNFSQNLSEKQIMSLEGLAWIYDCGHLKFILIKELELP